jgi:hypothetical protein
MLPLLQQCGLQLLDLVGQLGQLQRLVADEMLAQPVS